MLLEWTSECNSIDSLTVRSNNGWLCGCNHYYYFFFGGGGGGRGTICFIFDSILHYVLLEFVLDNAMYHHANHESSIGGPMPQCSVEERKKVCYTALIWQKEAMASKWQKWHFSEQNVSVIYTDVNGISWCLILHNLLVGWVFLHEIWPGRRAHYVNYENINNSNLEYVLASFCQSRAVYASYTQAVTRYRPTSAL